MIENMNSESHFVEREADAIRILNFLVNVSADNLISSASITSLCSIYKMQFPSSVEIMGLTGELLKENGNVIPEGTGYIFQNSTKSKRHLSKITWDGNGDAA